MNQGKKFIQAQLYEERIKCEKLRRQNAQLSQKVMLYQNHVLAIVTGGFFTSFKKFLNLRKQYHAIKDSII